MAQRPQKRRREGGGGHKEAHAEEALARQKREADWKRSVAETRSNAHTDLSTIYHLVADMDRKGEVDHGSFDENWARAERLVKRVRPALVDVLMANP